MSIINTPFINTCIKDINDKKVTATPPVISPYNIKYGKNFHVQDVLDMIKDKDS